MWVAWVALGLVVWTAIAFIAGVCYCHFMARKGY